MSIYYEPRNDNVVLAILGDKYVVEGVGPLVADLRRGDIVVIPDLDDESFCYEQLDEEATLLLVREHYILALEKNRHPFRSGGYEQATEDFHS